MCWDERVTQAPGRSLAPFFIVIALVAFNLRDVLTSVPTVLADIQQATGANAIMLGALTTLPVLCMGGLAIAVPMIAARLGATRTVWLALFILFVASGLRLAAQVPGVLPISALLAGTGIALASGLVPGIIRTQAPDRIGAATAAWTGAMFVGAAMGASLTVPLAQWLGSWQAALACWAIPAAIGLAAWTWYEKPHRARPTGGPIPRIRHLPWTDPVALALTAWVAINSIVFYSSVAWLAPSFTGRGLTQAQSGLVFGFFTCVQVIGAFGMPPLIHRARHPRVILTIIVLMGTGSLIALAFGSTPVAILALITYGLSLAAGFTGGLALIPMSSHDQPSAARLTAVVFTITYLFAAIGPVVCGAIVETTGSWQVLFVVLSVVCLTQVIPVPWMRRGALVQDPSVAASRSSVAS